MASIISASWASDSFWPAANTGTVGYVLGGTCFMVAKIFRLMLTIRKHKGEVAERNRVGLAAGGTHKVHHPQHWKEIANVVHAVAAVTHPPAASAI